MSSTAKDLVNHWDWAASKGVMNANSANALKTACTRVLEVEKGWEAQDITGLDVDAIVKRFRNLKAKSYTPDSLKEYERRFRKAHSSYLAYLRDPSSWKVAGRDRAPRNGKSEKAPSATTTAMVVQAPVREPQAGFVDYPFPLREGRIVRMNLPVDLKASEIKRLTAFLATLAVDNDSPEA
jgi:hypothetical protein